MMIFILVIMFACTSGNHFNCGSICGRHRRGNPINQSSEEGELVQEGTVNCYGKVCVVTTINYNKYEVPKPLTKPVLGTTHNVDSSVCKNAETASTLVVGTQYDITGVRGIDLKHGLIEVEMYVTMKWSDPEVGVCVCEGKESNDGVYNVGKDLEDNIWVPDLVVWHYKQFNRINGLVGLNDFQVKVHNNCPAELKYAFDFQVKLRCSMNLNWYPYDQNVCHVKLGSLTHTSDEVIFTQGEDTSKHTFIHSTYKDYKFKVLPLCKHLLDQEYTDIDGDVTMFRVSGFSLVIARKARRVVVEYGIVLSLLVLVSIFCSCLDLESGRAGVVAGSFLSVIFVLVLIDEYTPHVEGGTNQVMVYCIWCLGFIFICYLEYCTIMAVKRWSTKFSDQTLVRIDRSFFFLCNFGFVVFIVLFWEQFKNGDTQCHNEIEDDDLDCSVPF